jgi:hypothetical protein
MSMTTESEPTAPRNKGGRPRGTFGPRKRQLQLVRQYIDALGGDSKITPILERDITRAVALQSIAEESRRQINECGAASAKELLALARMEEVAEAAVRRLKLPAKP